MVEGTHRRLGYYVQKAATELARSDIDEAIRKSFDKVFEQIDSFRKFFKECGDPSSGRSDEAIARDYILRVHIGRKALALLEGRDYDDDDEYSHDPSYEEFMYGTFGPSGWVIDKDKEKS